MFRRLRVGPALAVRSVILLVAGLLASIALAASAHAMTAVAPARVPETAVAPVVGYGTPCVFSWAPVTTDTSGAAITVPRYHVYVDPPPGGVVPETTVPAATVDHAPWEWRPCEAGLHLAAGPHVFAVAAVHDVLGEGEATAAALTWATPWPSEPTAVALREPCTVTWQPPTTQMDGTPLAWPITAYRVYVDPAATIWWRTPASATVTAPSEGAAPPTTWTCPPTLPPGPHQVFVSAVAPGGVSAGAGPVTVTVPSPTPTPSVPRGLGLT